MPNEHAKERRVSARGAADWFVTPRQVTQDLLDRERFHGVVLDPCCGDGIMSEVLKENGYPVVSSDLHERGYGTGGVDFLAMKELPEGVRTIVCNPPFNIATKFISHALALGVEKMAVFNRLATLAGRKRRTLFFDNGHLEHLWVFSRRVTLAAGDLPLEERERLERKGGGTLDLGWFIFTKVPLQRQPTLGWIP